MTKDGRVKILDFGLAKLTQPDPESGGSQFSTDTAEGRVVGTAGYMAPEQVRGQTVDARTDIFAFGAVLYEMLSGRRAFVGDTPADTMTAILTKDPEELSRPGLEVPGGLERIVRRCLEKDPAERFQSAKDVAFALEAESGSMPSATLGRAPGKASRIRKTATAALALLLLLLGVTAGLMVGRRLWERSEPRFTQLTFRRGTVLSARFTADGNTVVYSALWDGKPPEIFSRRLDRPESASLGLPPAKLLSVSSAGELAILLTPPGERGAVPMGTLARAPLVGGAVRPLLENVLAADWSPDGTELAVLHMVDGVWQLEYPIGRVLMRPVPFYVDLLRVSPDGTRVAVATDTAGITILDRSGQRIRLLAPHPHFSAWTPAGNALLVASGEAMQYRTMHRVGLDGAMREVYSLPGTVVVHDVARSGRVLIHHGFERVATRARAPGEAAEREVGAYAASRPVALSANGGHLLLVDYGERGVVSLLRPTRGGPEVRLGGGEARGLSDDGQWVLMETSASGVPGLALTPVGTGSPVSLRLGSLRDFGPRTFYVDGLRVGFTAAEPGRPARSFWVEPPDAAPRAVTPEGVTAVPGLLDGERVLGLAIDGSVALYSIRGGPPQRLPWRFPLNRWSSEALCLSRDGRLVYVREGGVPARVDRIEIGTGRRSPWRVFEAESRAGVSAVYRARVTPDGMGYAYGYGEWLQDLYLVEGLRF